MAAVANNRTREFVEEKARLRVRRHFCLGFDDSFIKTTDIPSPAHQMRGDFVWENES